MDALLFGKCREHIAVGLRIVLMSAALQPAFVSAAQVRDRAIYDLPEQSLAMALETFAQISGREILYDGRLTDGRRSSLVQGSYSADVALHILLAGSGLRADAMDAHFFVLSATRAETSSAPTSRQTATYYAALQGGLRRALCGAQIADDHRIAARLWLGDSGQVLQVKLLGSGLSSESSESTATALRKLQVGQPPPGFAQPVTIVVRPRGDDDRACATPATGSAGVTP